MLIIRFVLGDDNTRDFLVNYKVSSRGGQHNELFLSILVWTLQNPDFFKVGFQMVRILKGWDKSYIAIAIDPLLTILNPDHSKTGQNNHHHFVKTI